AVRLVDHGRRLPSAGQLVLPDGLAGFQVYGPDQVVGGCRDVDEPASRHHRAAVVGRADIEGQARGDAEGSVLAGGAEGPVPQGVAGPQVDGADAAVGWL